MDNLLKDFSKRNLIIKNEGDVSVETIIASALIRVAESSESMAKSSQLMAQNFLTLQEEAAYYKKAYFEKRDDFESLLRTNSTLKGHITRLKNKSNQNQ